MKLLWSLWAWFAGCASMVIAADEPPSARLPDDGGLQQWSDVKGRTINAHFVRMEDGRVIVLEENGEKALPAKRLSPESLALAEAMSEVTGVFRDIGPGRFDMGSPADEPGRDDIETIHRVRVSKFRMKATEVTWTEWNAIRNFAVVNGYLDISEGSNGTNGFDADLNPVVGITWWDAVKWCNLKSQFEGMKPAYHTHKNCTADSVFKNGTAEIYVDWRSGGYRLPTEAEWEFACRAGRSKWAFHTGPIKETGVEFLDRNLDEAGWYAVNSKGSPHPVAGKRDNVFELYDMHGNAAEWCWDHYYGTTLGTREATNPRGPGRGEKRAVRGGSWNDPARACRTAARGGLTPGSVPDQTVGFRPVR